MLMKFSPWTNEKTMSVLSYYPTNLYLKVFLPYIVLLEWNKITYHTPVTNDTWFMPSHPGSSRWVIIHVQAHVPGF